MYFPNGRRQMSPYSVIVLLSPVMKEIFASRCHSFKIELERCNFQGMSQICQKITVPICEANFQLLHKKPYYHPHPIQGGYPDHDTHNREAVKKNPAYGRHRITRLMRILEPIQFWRVCKIYLEKKRVGWRVYASTHTRVRASTRRIHAGAMDALHPPPVFRAPRV